MKSGATLIALALFAAPAAAECYGVEADFTPGAILLGKVTAKKAFFHNEARQPTKAYVLKGDEVLAHPVDDGWVCATFIGKKGVDTSGLVKASNLVLRAPKPMPLQSWIGDWTTGKWQNLTLAKGSKPGWISVEGEAYWASSEEAALNGGLNMGNIGGEGPLENGLVGFTQTEDESYKPYAEASPENFDCAILVQALGTNYLMVEDTGNCGGHNVRFTGLYAKGKVEFE